MAYIYKIINDINQKIYIGKTEFSIQKRFKQHCKDAFRDRNEKRPLYAAMRKYGIQHFYIELIEKTNNPEEREKYWIQYYNSYKNGYNATLGGDGKAYIDRNLVIETYQKLQNQKQVAQLLNIDKTTIRKILRENNINILSSSEINKQKLSKKVKMIDKQTKQTLKHFNSLGEAAHYLIDNKLTNCKFSTIRYHISEVCNKKRQSAAGFNWEFD